jgi:DNA polymerase-3 subunit gamma/tau
VNAIRLFNEAVTDLRRGFQTIPQLPLEMALVESLLEAAAAAPQPQVEAAAPTIPPTGDEPQATAAETGQSNDSAPVTTTGGAPVTAAGETPAPAPQAEESQSTTPAGGLSLAQMTGAWEQVLQAVRQRNPAAEGALRSGCRPVEVQGSEVVITFPYPFLREKLGDPQRKSELQDALSEVLGIQCRVKLVLADEYKPRPRSTPPAEPGNPAPASASAPKAESSGQTDHEAEEEAVPPNVSRWIKEHGGTVEFVES